MEFLIFKRIWEGKTLLRILMNAKVTEYAVSGKNIDIGGGINPEYHSLFQKEPTTTIESIDLKAGTNHGKSLDLEKDVLPFKDGSVHGVLLFNILEHIYNHRFVVGQAYRILGKDGYMVGFVPFLINYHPDPHDYFRYTHEALRKIFSEAGFRSISIEEIGGGPFSANYNTLMLSVPRIVRIVMWPAYYLLDMLFLHFRPQAKKRYPLGYFFRAEK